YLPERLRHTWLPGLLLLVWAGIQIYCIHRLSINYDEGSFAAYGRDILRGKGYKDVLHYDSKLPISALNMLPRAVEQVLHPGLKKTSNTVDVIRGRYVSLLAALLLGALIYHWAGKLYGKSAALCSLLLYLLCPNFLAHGIFLSSDIFACLFMTAAFYGCWRFRQTNSTRDFIFLSFAVAMAEVSKFSMVHLGILVPLLLLIGSIADKKRPSLKRTPALAAVFIAANWLVISAAHLFYGMFRPLGDYHFYSTTFQHLQSALPHGLPVPLPASYVSSMDIVIYFDKLGGGVPGALNGAPYILGQHSVHGFWYYYFVALGYKLPIPVLLLFLFSFLTCIRSWRDGHFLRREIYLLLPAFYYLIYMSFFYGTQVGIRHIIIILPLLYIYTGLLTSRLQSLPARAFGYALLVWQLVSVGIRFPHFLPYTNEFITDKKMAYTKIADTNLCYGEGEPFLNDYLHAHPDAIYRPDSITAGKIVMEVNDMLDMSIGLNGKYAWPLSLTPVDHIHSEYLIYAISPAMADSLKQLQH
ncbi:MAG: glycosyltransferase family 39 protein, partial [Bacteroidetes bacterium]|nr:glycosyltransferase family 39 protein [Bacteroidota bacterium]